MQLCADVVKLAGPTIVFCKTKRGTDQLTKKLERHRGARPQAIHGNRSQGQRERALAAFSTGDVDAMIATDVAARGIHVDDVACVVHFDPPHDAKDYTHRSGRTARAGAAGTVISLISRDQERDAKRMQRSLGLPQGIASVDRAALGTLTPDSVRARPRPLAAQSATGCTGRGLDAVARRRLAHRHHQVVRLTPGVRLHRAAGRGRPVRALLRDRGLQAALGGPAGRVRARARPQG